MRLLFALTTIRFQARRALNWPFLIMQNSLTINSGAEEKLSPTLGYLSILSELEEFCPAFLANHVLNFVLGGKQLTALLGTFDLNMLILVLNQSSKSFLEAVFAKLVSALQILQLALLVANWAIIIFH